MSKIEEAVLNCMSVVTGLEPSDFEDIKSENLFEIGILDSLSFVTIIDNIEEKLNIKIDLRNVDVNNFNTLNSMINYLESINGQKTI